ncbi:hypothetical protein CALVIDRAFT_72336 [Calocera viscosa TUFC12733]|uniref:Uncharacterized protein n=1 Tax=Calocera viscosa (strain TUFC12733) TaxID=1330018 RepID=A0A167NBN2_CALVF|nr:hypothetical protein CALVIDRAFT_72336 [Calocera viscosa TUFC12733]
MLVCSQDSQSPKKIPYPYLQYSTHSFHPPVLGRSSLGLACVVSLGPLGRYQTSLVSAPAPPGAPLRPPARPSPAAPRPPPRGRASAHAPPAHASSPPPPSPPFPTSPQISPPRASRPLAGSARGAYAGGRRSSSLPLFPPPGEAAGGACAVDAVDVVVPGGRGGCLAGPTRIRKPGRRR